jgi:hypothetical protein
VRAEGRQGDGAATLKGLCSVTAMSAPTSATHLWPVPTQRDAGKVSRQQMTEQPDLNFTSAGSNRTEKPRLCSCGRLFVREPSSRACGAGNESRAADREAAAGSEPCIQSSPRGCRLSGQSRSATRGCAPGPRCARCAPNYFPILRRQHGRSGRRSRLPTWKVEQEKKL